MRLACCPMAPFCWHRNFAESEPCRILQAAQASFTTGIYVGGSSTVSQFEMIGGSGQFDGLGRVEEFALDISACAAFAQRIRRPMDKAAYAAATLVQQRSPN